MTATMAKPLTENQRRVYDFFSPGCRFNRADLVKLTRMQGNALTFPLMSLVKRGLVAEVPGETVKDAITYTMGTEPSFEAEKAAFMDDLETAYILDDAEMKARLLREPAAPRMMPGQEPYTETEMARVHEMVAGAARAEEAIGADALETAAIRLVSVAPDGTEDTIAPSAKAETVRALTAARVSGAKPKAERGAKEYRTTGAYRIEGRAKKNGAGLLYVAVWTDTGETLRWQVAGGKSGTYTLRIQADDEAAAIRWAARQFPAATMDA